MRSTLIRLIIILAALLGCVTYVLDTYNLDDSRVYRLFTRSSDITIFSIFLVDYIMNIIYADARIHYIFSFQGVVDFASLLSIINVFSNTNLSFLTLFRLMRVIKMLRLFRMSSSILIDDLALPVRTDPLSLMQLNALIVLTSLHYFLFPPCYLQSVSEAIYFEILGLVLGILLTWFLFSSVLYTIIQNNPDSFVYNSDPDFEIQEDIRFFDCVYMMAVFTSTLGFGDFSPNNFLGRLFVVVVLVTALTVVPVKVGQLVETIRKKPQYMSEVAYKICMYYYLQTGPNICLIGVVVPTPQRT